MKRKVLLLVLVVFLILILASCGPHFHNGDDESSQAEQTVYEYWIAIINRQYDLAKWHCITDGVWYNKTDEWEEYINTNSKGEASVIIWFGPFYKITEVFENRAIVYPRITVDILSSPGSYGAHGKLFEYEIELVKSFSLGWKLE